jgi:transglutaminase-like putative cysteine protease
MRPFYLALLATALLHCSQVNAQNRNAKIEKTPDWVIPVNFDATATPKAGQEEGFYCLLIDEQENTPQQETFTHIAYKILTAEGVQTMSDLSFNFDPSYQVLKLNILRVYRGSEVIDKKPSTIQTIQREQSMDRYLYDGSLTAILNLSDVRVGDIIEYAYTIKGYNPVYEGHVGRKIYFSYNFAYEKLFERLVVPQSLTLDLDYRNAEIKPEIKTNGSLKEYVWSQTATDAFVSDSNVPDWYDGYNYVMATNFSDWSQVASWAMRHFQVSDADRVSLRQRMGTTFETSDKHKFTLDAIRFVQDEVRYLGFESGLNSHKPHPPLEVFEQRFGDCKDKSLLLCAMLSTAGIEAYPVLVNTALRHKVEDESPSIGAFNHCVVQIKLDNDTYYVDPTISSQGGGLRGIPFPPYGKGLIIKEGTSTLEQLFSHGNSDVTEAQIIAIPDLKGSEAYLQVTTTYTGGEAEYMRRQFVNNNAETIQKNYLTFYSNLFADIEVLTPIKHHDNRKDNILTLEENYRIPAFWKTSEADGDVLFAEIFPQTLQNYFDVTKSTQRTTPHRLEYPVSYHHSIDIKLPEEWNVETDEEYIDNDYYHYEYYVRHSGKQITLETHYRTKQDHIPAEAIPQFISDHQKMFNNLSFQLSFNKNLINNERGVSWLGIISAFIALGFGMWLAFRLFYYYDPKPVHRDPAGGEPIGGWLILVAIGLVFTPFRIAYDLFNLPEMYNSQMWANFLVLKRYDLFAFTLITHVYNIVLLCYVILILALFFTRRSSLPKLITIYFAVNCFMIVSDSLLAVALDVSVADEKDYFRNMLSSILAAVIWIPYFNMSTRVKNTFVTRIGDDDDDLPYATAETGSNTNTVAI